MVLTCKGVSSLVFFYDMIHLETPMMSRAEYDIMSRLLSFILVELLAKSARQSLWHEERKDQKIWIFMLSSVLTLFSPLKKPPSHLEKQKGRGRNSAQPFWSCLSAGDHFLKAFHANEILQRPRWLWLFFQTTEVCCLFSFQLQRNKKQRRFHLILKGVILLDCFVC